MRHPGFYQASNDNVWISAGINGAHRKMTGLEGIRVVIADDDRDFRDAIAVLIELVPELAVTGKAASAEEAFRLVDSTQADACLIDLFMPGMSGVEAVRHLRASHPGLVIVVMTGFDDEEKLQAAREAGAEAAIRKHRLLSDVGERLRSIRIEHARA